MPGSPASEVHGRYHWLERPVGSWETNRSLTLPSCWKLWPQLQSGCLGNTFQLQPWGAQLLLEICQGCSRGRWGVVGVGKSEGQGAPRSGSVGLIWTLLTVTICISGSHSWLPSERMLTPGLHPRPVKLPFWEGAHVSTFVISKAPPGNSRVLSRLRNTEGDQYKQTVVKGQNGKAFDI